MPKKLALAIDLWTLQQVVNYSVLHGDTDEGASALTQSQMKKKCNKQKEMQQAKRNATSKKKCNKQKEIVPYQHLTNANG
jgi:hypothetical protein